MLFRVIFSSPFLAGVRVIEAFTIEEAILKIKKFHSNNAIAKKRAVHYDALVNGLKDKHLMYRLDAVRTLLTKAAKKDIFGAFQKLEIRLELDNLDQYVYSKLDFEVLTNFKLHIASPNARVYECFRLLNAVEVTLNYNSEGTIFN